MAWNVVGSPCCIQMTIKIKMDIYQNVALLHFDYIERDSLEMYFKYHF